MSSSDDDAPKRFIYNQQDMEHFRNSTARKELSSFVCAMGRGLITTNSNNTTIDGGYNSNSPLQHLTPALASLHGSLTCISQTWMEQIPPDLKVKARFGNPAFRTWHAQLVDRSYGIVRSLMDCHVKYSSGGVDNNCIDMEDEAKQQILKDCSDQGYHAATRSWSKDNTTDDTTSLSKQEEIITELQAYLHDGFGHPIRIDYGTGHESSFIVFLLSLCKIGCFSWGSHGTSSTSSNNNKDTNSNQSSSETISLGSLSIFHAYLSVTRGLQRDYMLEPAGSHGVWGLDDYHCVPFYLGACQMVAREQCQKQQSMKKKKCISNDQTVLENNQIDNDKEDETTKRMPDNPYLPEATSTSATDPSSSSSSTTTTIDTHNDNNEHWGPSVIHDKQIMENHRSTYLYLSCIHFIQQIKPGVPFFESSPMLNDISHLGNWTKVSSGLLRLYEGEVLDKLPVVQHFVFGKIFNADWEPSRKVPLEAPTKTFVNGPMGEECIAPWASNTNTDVSSSSMPPPTRAPWAK